MVVPTFWFSTQFYIVFGISIVGWRGGSHPFYGKLRGEAQSFVNFKKGITDQVFSTKPFPLFTTTPPEIKNDNSPSSLYFSGY